MQPNSCRQVALEAPAVPVSDLSLVSSLRPAKLPPAVAAVVWRGDELGRPATITWPTGFAALDAVLPGGGWPGGALTELMLTQAGALEFRLFGPLLGRVAAQGGRIVVVGPPRPLHAPGLLPHGIPTDALIWVRAETVAERLWTIEQLLKAGTCGAVLAWLPQARPDQLRRLQVHAAASAAPAMLCRPAQAARESSAAPLRLQAHAGQGWQLRLDVLKRKGPPLARTLTLSAPPAGLPAVWPARLAEVGRPGPTVTREADHAVVCADAARHRRMSPSH
ncbi:MAG: translesion DNA synthesis-associated protein ImuA [Gammaproteobacteria bacterium]